MRSLLILSGLILSGIVAFVVAWPRLVDPEALRAELTRILRTIGGDGLEFQGAIRLELLPLPHISIERVVLGERAATAAGERFEADRLDVDVAPLALLAGRVEPHGLQLVRPRLVVADEPAAFAPRILAALEHGDLAGVRRVEIIDGSAVLLAAEGTAWPGSVEAMDLAATREGIDGFRLEGTAAIAGEPLRVELTGAPLAAAAPIALQLALASGPRDVPATLDLRGSLRPEADGLRLTGRLRLATTNAPLPKWLERALGVAHALPPLALQAGLDLAPGSLRLDELAVDLGGGRLRGSFSLALAAERRFQLALDGTEIAATPELTASLRGLAPLLTSPSGLTGLVAVRVAAIGWRDGQIRRLRAELATAPGGQLDLRHFEATLPGDTAVSWEGGDPLATGSVTGALSVQAGELQPLLRWLGLDGADLPSDGLTSLDLTGMATLGTDRLEMHDLKARVDASQLRGNLALVIGPRPRLDLALTLDRVNAALYAPELPAPATRQLWRDRLAGLDGTLDLAVERPSYDALRGQDLRLRLGIQDGSVTIDELRLGAPDQASLMLHGAVGLAAETYDLTGGIELAQPGPILRLLRLNPPPELQRLAPLRLSGTAKGDPAGAAIDLRLEATDASATLAGTFGGSAVALAGALTATDTGPLLVALGWPAPTERPALGPLDLALGIHRGDGPYALSLGGTVGTSDLSTRATLDPGGQRPRLDGQLDAKRLDTALLAALYDTAALPLAFPPGRPWLWPGAWPTQPLGWQWLDAVDLGLTVAVAQLQHRGRDLPGVSGRAAIEGGQLSLSGVTLPLAGGTVAGTATLERAHGSAVLGADLRLAGARVETLAAAVAPGSELTGELDVAAELVGQGRSIADLIATLRGTGQLALRGGQSPGIAFGPADLSMAGPFTVESGVLTSSVLPLPDGASARLQLDLLSWMLDATITTDDAERRFLGNPGRPQALTP